ncbi:MAG TPA: NAD(P)-dependent alcohol dehydrogenase [Pseudomonadales bacterium]
MKAFVVKAGSTSLEGLAQVERPQPEPGPGEILVQMHAAALNFRDLAIVTGRYFGGAVQKDLVALSDGAGEVVAIGSGVTRFKVGDRVAGTFFRSYVDGPPVNVGPALGSPVDGVLAEYVVFNQNDAVHIPRNHSFVEAATLPCAGVTAWHALMVAGRPVKPGDTVLVLGSGGVSLHAMQLAQAAGARVVATSSNAGKETKLKGLGAIATINYRTCPDWHAEVLKATGGAGVDCVVEVGGAGTLKQSILSLGVGGKIALIGVLSGPAGDTNPHGLMLKGGSIHGVFVGNRAMFEQLVRATETNDIHPVIDRIFRFDETPQAFQYLQSQAHFGKVVVSIA